jgi:aspartate racemase
LFLVAAAGRCYKIKRLSERDGEPAMSDVSTIGVLGGMGPEATNRLCALITRETPARRDQEHIPVITFNNSLIPPRVAAMSGAGESPVPEMIRTARLLEQAGARLLVMPCNLAHYFIREVQSEVRIPILNMIEETVKFVVSKYPSFRTAGLLASTPTIEYKLYEDSFARYQRTLITPPSHEQEAKVMEAIYGQGGIKSGHREAPRRLLMDAAQKLIERGAELIIAGCTEISLVLDADLSCPLIDPLEIIARVVVARATSARQAQESTDSVAVRAGGE